MMKCRYCKDTGKYKQPKDVERFDKFIDVEMDKAYTVNYEIAAEKAYKEIGYTVIDCPYCSRRDEE